MTSHIGIDWNHGRPATGADQDEARAIAAAERVLGDTDFVTAHEEYTRQFSDLDGENGMTGLAALWVKAQEAANIALTEGWHSPDGGDCCIRAYSV